MKDFPICVGCPFETIVGGFSNEGIPYCMYYRICERVIDKLTPPSWTNYSQK